MEFRDHRTRSKVYLVLCVEAKDKQDFSLYYGSKNTSLKSKIKLPKMEFQIQQIQCVRLLESVFADGISTTECVEFSTRTNNFPTPWTQTRRLTTYFNSDPNYPTTWRFNLCISSRKFKSSIFNLNIAPLQMPGANPGLLYFRPYYKTGIPTTVSLPLLERLTEKFRKTIYLLLPFIIKDTSQKQAKGQCIRQGTGGRGWNFLGVPVSQNLDVSTNPESHKPHCLGFLWTFHYTGILN